MATVSLPNKTFIKPATDWDSSWWTVNPSEHDEVLAKMLLAGWRTTSIRSSVAAGMMGDAEAFKNNDIHLVAASSNSMSWLATYSRDEDGSIRYMQVKAAVYYRIFGMEVSYDRKALFA